MRTTAQPALLAATSPAVAVSSPAATARARSAALLGALPRELAWQVRSARELAPPPRDEARPTTVAALDRLLRGGLERGALTELVGRRSSGRFAAVAATLAATTAGGEAAALVDLGDGLDPRHAEAAGVDLERLLLARPRRLSEALAATEHLLAGGFPLVVVELGMPPVAGGRGVEAAWLRLARLALAHRATLLVASPYRVSGTAAAAVVLLHGGRARWRSAAVASGDAAGCPLLVTITGEATLEKRRGEAGGREESLHLRVAEDLLPAPTAGQSAPERRRSESGRPAEPVRAANARRGAAVGASGGSGVGGVGGVGEDDRVASEAPDENVAIDDEALPNLPAAAAYHWAYANPGVSRRRSA